MKSIFSAIAAAAALCALSSCGGQPEVNGRWDITSVAGTTVSVADSLSESAPFIEFNAAEGRIHGNTGCNIMNGSYTLDGKKLTLGPVATTMMAGPEAMMELESKVLDAVNSAASVKSVSEDRLQVLDAEGNVTMELTRAEAE